MNNNIIIMIVSFEVEGEPFVFVSRSCECQYFFVTRVEFFMEKKVRWVTDNRIVEKSREK